MNYPEGLYTDDLSPVFPRKIPLDPDFPDRHWQHHGGYYPNGVYA